MKEVEEGRRKEVGREEETRDGRSTKQRENGRMEDVHLYTVHT